MRSDFLIFIQFRSLSLIGSYHFHYTLLKILIMKVADTILIFRMRKAKIEATVMAPTYVEDNIKHLAHNVSWEK